MPKDEFDDIMDQNQVSALDKQALADEFLNPEQIEPDPVIDILKHKWSGFTKGEMKWILRGQNLGLSEPEIRQIMSGYGANGV